MASSGLSHDGTKPEQLRSLICQSVARTSSDGILFSGGLDTSVIATVASRQGRRLRAFCVCTSGADSPDEPFATRLASELELELKILRPSASDLVEQMSAVIRLLNTFDPMELRNSVVTYAGLQAAAAAGVAGVLTGDASDELFAGYSYMFNMPADQLLPYIQHLDQVMHFTSRKLGTALGISVELPYLDQQVRTFALNLRHSDLVGEHDGVRCGKKILREAFAGLLPEDFAWRRKTPIEYGSGSTVLKEFAAAGITDDEFACARQAAASDGVRLRDKEQYFYYRLYRRIHPPPSEQERGSKACPDCCGPVPRGDMRYCRICGAYPI